MHAIILEDHESKDLYVAEVNWKEDIDKIIDAKNELNNEYRAETNEWDDFYEEMWKRTWLNIYMADILST